jgi:hypothetical protein
MPSGAPQGIAGGQGGLLWGNGGAGGDGGKVGTTTKSDLYGNGGAGGSGSTITNKDGTTTKSDPNLPTSDAGTSQPSKGFFRPRSNGSVMP